MTGESKPHITPNDVIEEIERRLRECRAENKALRNAVVAASTALDEAIDAECGARSGEAGEAYDRAYSIIRETADLFPAPTPADSKGGTDA